MTALRPARSLAHWPTLSAGRRTDAGRICSPSGRTSIMAGQLGVPISRESLSGLMLLVADMERPFRRKDAILQHVASWGDRVPHRLLKVPATAQVKQPWPE